MLMASHLVCTGDAIGNEKSQKWYTIVIWKVSDKLSDVFAYTVQLHKRYIDSMASDSKACSLSQDKASCIQGNPSGARIYPQQPKGGPCTDTVAFLSLDDQPMFTFLQ